MSRRVTGFATRAIHHGYHPEQMGGALVPPIHLTSTYTFANAAQGGRRFAQEEQGLIYSRLGNPTTQLVEARMADLEGAEAAVVTASGMGAISSLMWTVLRPGDTLLADKTLYGCTFSFFHHALAEFGITVRHIDMLRPGLVAASMDDTVKAVYFETPANPNMRVVDIARVCQEARGTGFRPMVVVDSTYMSPYLQRPLEHGADVVVHSATKYLGGHGDLLAGVVAGSSELMTKVRLMGVKDMTGSCLSAFDGHLLMRGIKTLNLRMERHCQTALQVAERLQVHPAVSRVRYPGLASDPGHEVMRRQSSGSGGVIAFDLVGGRPAALAFLDGLEMVARAVSLGDCETLAQHPATMTHSTYTDSELAEHDIDQGTVRLSIGLEDLEDVWDDLGGALDGVAKLMPRSA